MGSGHRHPAWRRYKIYESRSDWHDYGDTPASPQLDGLYPPLHIPSDPPSAHDKMLNDHLTQPGFGASAVTQRPIAATEGRHSRR
jgi:hypothetical protein